ncbi:MAG: glycosyltransferase [Solirubrobacterales bacterium]|nr:glycosyltransferase [Solirubrobacterales bacterium]
MAVVPSEPGNTAERLRDGGVEVILRPMHRLRATLRPSPHLALARHGIGEITALRRIVREQQAAVVQSHGDLNPHAGIAGHLEGAAVHWQILDSRTPVALRYVTMPLACRLADSFAAIGYELARSHPGVLDFGERYVTIYTAVDPARFARSAELRVAARAELRVPEGAFCVGAIGNRNPQKGHEWLVRAAGSVRTRHPQIAVRVLGAASPGHEHYEQRLREEAAALGLREQDGSFAIVDPGARVPDLIGALDALCMSSVPNSEGIPTVILEAMTAGIPVVATDVGAVSEVVMDGVTGRVVPARDGRALSDARARLADDAALRARLVAAGRERVHTHFSLERLVDLYAHSYNLAMAHRATRRRRAALSAYGPSPEPGPPDAPETGHG